MTMAFVCLCVCASVAGPYLHAGGNPGRWFQANRGRYAEPPLGPARLQVGPVQLAADHPVAVTPAGRIRGSWMETRRGRRFQAYRGIRYAEPPVGPLRFQPPKPVVEYRDEVDATEEGPACPMAVGDVSIMDEDCLTINVYTPTNNNTRNLPVVVYIHSGGFVLFSGRSEVAGPHYLLDRDLVFVTMNYRLGSLGFLALGTKDAPGNNGYKDQVVALKWIRRNIASFGGDPNLVTITGCSAGSLSVLGHLISPMSTGLFHRAIGMSGSPISKVPSPSDRLDLAVMQARQLNCPTHSPHAIYTCLNTKTWQELRGISAFLEFGSDPHMYWRAIVELDFGQERFLPVEPMDAIRAGPRNSVPYIISQTRDEFFWRAYDVLNNETLRKTMDREWDRIAPISFILPRDNAKNKVRALRRAYFGERELTNNADTAYRLGKLYGDALTAFPVHRLANLMCRHSRHPVWYYEFDYIGNRSYYEDPITKRPAGVSHQDDLLYLLSTSRFPLIAVDDSADSNMVDKMTAIWYNFARFGEPSTRAGGPGPARASLRWPAMSPGRREYLRLDDRLSLGHKLKEDRFMLWDALYPIQY